MKAGSARCAAGGVMKNTKQWVRAVCLILAALMLLSTLGALVYQLAYLF